LGPIKPHLQEYFAQIALQFPHLIIFSLQLGQLNTTLPDILVTFFLHEMQVIPFSITISESAYFIKIVGTQKKEHFSQFSPRSLSFVPYKQ